MHLIQMYVIMLLILSLNDGNDFLYLMTDVDECEISPCWNNGTCVNLLGGYQCNCSDDFEGDQCETGWIRLNVNAENK